MRKADKVNEVKVYFTDEQKERIKGYGEERGMSLSGFIRMATLQYTKTLRKIKP